MSDVKSVCRFFLEGTCRRGRKCRFLHPRDQAQSATSSPAAKPNTKPSAAPPPSSRVRTVSSSSDSSSSSSASSSSSSPSHEHKLPTQKGHGPTATTTVVAGAASAPMPAPGSPDSKSESSSSSATSSRATSPAPAVVASNGHVAARHTANNAVPPPADTSDSEPEAPERFQPDPTSAPVKRAASNDATTENKAKRAKTNDGVTPSSSQKKSKSKAPGSKNKSQDTARLSLLWGMEALHLLVARTRSHTRFASLYGYAQPRPAGWLETSGARGFFGGSRAGHTVVGLDCEMVQTAANTSALSRITVVALGSCEKGVYPCKPRVLLDLYVKPDSPVVDYRTTVSGITEEHLQNACSLHDAQQAFLKIVTADTVIVGHSLHYDLESLRVSHNLVIDTSLLFTLEGGDKSISLKDLTKSLLKEDMQPHGQAHDSIMDALWPLEIVRHVVDTLEDEGPIPTTPDKPLSHLDKLFAVSRPDSYKRRLGFFGLPHDVSLEQLQKTLEAFPALANGHWKPLNKGRTSVILASEEDTRSAFVALPCTSIGRASDGMLKKNLPLADGKSSVWVKVYAPSDPMLENMVKK